MITTIEEFLKKPFKGSIHLEEFDFSAENEEQINKLSKAIEENNNLNSVVYSNKPIDALDLTKVGPIFSAISRNRNITLFSLNRCELQKLTEEKAKQLFELIKISNVSRLWIERDILKNLCPAISYILLKLDQLPLKDLSFQGTRLGDLEFGIKLDMIRTIIRSNIISLSFAFTSFFSDDGGKASNEAYSMLLIPLFEGNIQDLSLRGNLLGCSYTEDDWETCDNIINYDDWEKIFNRINQRKVLKELDLCGCDLGNLVGEEAKDFVALFESFLKRNSDTLKVDISNNHFSSELDIRFTSAMVPTPVVQQSQDSSKISVHEEAKEKQDTPPQKPLIHSKFIKTILDEGDVLHSKGSRPTNNGKK